ncbi:hypothetical protein JCM11491_000412 [Sporobolomyces phaffii]
MSTPRPQPVPEPASTESVVGVKVGEVPPSRAIPEVPPAADEVPDESIDPTLRDLDVHHEPRRRPGLRTKTKKRRPRPLTVSLDYTDSSDDDDDEPTLSGAGASDEFRLSDLDEDEQDQEDDELEWSPPEGDIIVGDAPVDEPAPSASTSSNQPAPSLPATNTTARPNERAQGNPRPRRRPRDQASPQRKSAGPRPMAKQRRRLIEIGALPAVGRVGKYDSNQIVAYGGIPLRSVEGGQRAKSCENCRLRKARCSSHQICRNCAARNEQCVWIVGAPLYPIRYVGPLHSLAPRASSSSSSTSSPLVVPPRRRLGSSSSSSRAPRLTGSGSARLAPPIAGPSHHRTGPLRAVSSSSSPLTTTSPRDGASSSVSSSSYLRFPSVTYSSLVAEHSRLAKAVQVLTVRWCERERALAQVQDRPVARCVSLVDIPFEETAVNVNVDEDASAADRPGRDEEEDGGRERGPRTPPPTLQVYEYEPGGEESERGRDPRNDEGRSKEKGKGKEKETETETETEGVTNGLGEVAGAQARTQGNPSAGAQEESVGDVATTGDTPNDAEAGTKTGATETGSAVRASATVTATAAAAAAVNPTRPQGRTSREETERVADHRRTGSSRERPASAGGRAPPATTALPATTGPAPLPSFAVTRPSGARERTEWEDAAILLTLSQPQTQGQAHEEPRPVPRTFVPRPTFPPPANVPRRALTTTAHARPTQPCRPVPAPRRLLPPPPLPPPLPPRHFPPSTSQQRTRRVPRPEPYVQHRPRERQASNSSGQQQQQQQHRHHPASATVNPSLISGGGYVNPGSILVAPQPPPQPQPQSKPTNPIPQPEPQPAGSTTTGPSQDKDKDKVKDKGAAATTASKKKSTTAKRGPSKRGRFEGTDHSILLPHQIPAGYRPVGDGKGYGKDQDGHELPTTTTTPVASTPAAAASPSSPRPLVLPVPPPGYRPLSEAPRSNHHRQHRYDPYARPRAPLLPTYPRQVASDVRPPSTTSRPEPPTPPMTGAPTIDPVSMLPAPTWAVRPEKKQYVKRRRGGGGGGGGRNTLPRPSPPVFFPSIPTATCSDRERHEVALEREAARATRTAREYRETRRKWHEARYNNAVGGGDGPAGGGGGGDGGGERGSRGPSGGRPRGQTIERGGPAAAKKRRVDRSAGPHATKSRANGGSRNGAPRERRRGGIEPGNGGGSTSLAIQAAETWAALYAVTDRQEGDGRARMHERNRLPPIVVPVEPYRPIAAPSHPLNFRSSQDPMLGIGPLTAGIVEPDEGASQRSIFGGGGGVTGGTSPRQSTIGGGGPGGHRPLGWSTISPIVTSPSLLAAAPFGSNLPSARAIAGPDESSLPSLSSVFEPFGGTPRTGTSPPPPSFPFSRHPPLPPSLPHSRFVVESPTRSLPPHPAAALLDVGEGFDERFEPRIEQRFERRDATGQGAEAGGDGAGTGVGSGSGGDRHDDPRGRFEVVEWDPFEPRIEPRSHEGPPEPGWTGSPWGARASVEAGGGPRTERVAREGSLVREHSVEVNVALAALEEVREWTG